MKQDSRVSFIGGGNMAAALIGGMIERGVPPAAVQVVELSAQRCAWLTDRFGVRAVDAHDERVLESDMLVLAVKPQQMRTVVEALAGKLAHQLVISIAAGLRVADLGRWLGGYARVVRAMPNTPALVGAGLTGLYAPATVDASGKAAAESVMSAVGSVVWVDDETRMDALAAVSGSGPAYVFHFIEALEEGAVALGFEQAQARRLALETVLGAARLAASSEDPPALLRERVTSKGGTTAAALEVMAEAGFKQTIARALAAAEARGRALGDELGRS